MQKHRLLIICLIFLSGCSIAEFKKNREESIIFWNQRAASPEFQKEKTKFAERIGGKKVCWLGGLANYTQSSELPPKDCLFPTSPYTESDGQVGRAVNRLKVVQALPQGFLANTSWKECSRNYCADKIGENFIFIHRSDEGDLVDGSFIDPVSDYSIYEYAGPFTYNSVGGIKTVHSFRKKPADYLLKANAGFKFFSYYQELLSILGLWEELAKDLKKEAPPKAN
jgi:hypothetical protein